MFQIRFAEIIKKKGTNRNRIAQDTGLKTSLLHAYIKGTSIPSIDKLCILADYFGVSSDYLLGRDGNDESLSDGSDKSLSIDGDINDSAISLEGDAIYIKADTKDTGTKNTEELEETEEFEEAEELEEFEKFEEVEDIKNLGIENLLDKGMEEIKQTYDKLSVRSKIKFINFGYLLEDEDKEIKRNN